MIKSGYYPVRLFTVRSFESNRFTRKCVNIDFFSNWRFDVAADSRCIRIFISTYIINTGHEKTIGKKTESFHRDRVLATLIKYLLLLYTSRSKRPLYNIILSTTHARSSYICISHPRRLSSPCVYL